MSQYFENNKNLKSEINKINAKVKDTEFNVRKLAFQY